jgi:hypothetical protein
MTNEEFQQAELDKLPEAFRAAVSRECYDRGHAYAYAYAYGHEEVLNHIRSTVAWLLPCIQAHDAQRGG